MKGLLGSILAEPRQHAERTGWDLVLLFVVLFGAVSTDAHPLATAGIVFPLAVASWFRKAWPLGSCLAGLTIGFIAARTVDPSRDASTLGLLILMYALARWASGRNVLIGLGAILLVGPSISSMQAEFGSDVPLAAQGLAFLIESVMQNSMWLAPLVIGVVIRSRAGSHARDVIEARSKERAELARELHDTVAHHVSVIAVQAQAGQAVASLRPEGAVEALQTIEEEATRTLDEMRQMVRVLRSVDDQAETAPQAGIRQIEALAEPSGRPPVRVEMQGDFESLHPTVEASLFRIAQEATTNARRHARGARQISITVDADDTEVHLVVSDDGRKSAAPDHAAGFGLVGMAERVALLDGRFLAAPGKDRGWVVEATLPRSGVPA